LKKYYIFRQNTNKIKQNVKKVALLIVKDKKLRVQFKV
jgi:hypothetical protein